MRHKIYYVRNEKNKKTSVMTAIAELHPDKTWVNIAVAFSSHKDQFTRKKGRDICYGRLEKGKVYCVPFTGQSGECIVHCFNEVMSDCEKPRFWKKHIMVYIKQGGLQLVQKV